MGTKPRPTEPFIPANSLSVRRPRVKIVDEIIETLRQDIVTRRLADGERLPSEKDLSDRLGVSQSTVREALRALETIGLVDVLHGSGSFVRSQGGYGLAAALQTLLQLESVSIAEVLDVRQVLGRLSVKEAASRATDDDIKAIEAAFVRFDDLSDAQDVEGIIARIIGFQRAVSAASHAPLLQTLEVFLMILLVEVQVKTVRNRGARFWRSRALEFQPFRAAILEGLRRADPVEASVAMDRYFDAQRARFEKVDGLKALSLSSPTLKGVVEKMVREFKN